MEFKYQIIVQSCIAITLFFTLKFTVGQSVYEYTSSKMSSYRDKSALFGRELKSGEAPSWP